MPTVTANGVQLYFESAGQGFPVVLCHGYNSSHYDWALQIPMLARNYQVVAMDHRGHGISAAPSAKSEYSISIFSQDVKTILRHLKIERCCLVGQSMGGFIALQFVINYPQLVSALVLVSTSTKLEGIAEYDRMMRHLHEIARTNGLEAAFEHSTVCDPLTKEYLEKYPDRREAAKQRMLNTSLEGYIYAWEAIAEWTGVSERLSEITVPVKIIVGEEDSFFLNMAKSMAKVIPHSQLCVMPKVGHSPQEEAPSRFNRELSIFLAGLSGQQNRLNRQ